ncbi:MAG: hypothetical protein JEZ11_11360 [Desulfobacterales bacterium]|nr:hypothetical protein [Desulfobacterales bacterium]
MTSETENRSPFLKPSTRTTLIAFVVIGLGTFAFQLASGHPERAWLAYLVNFLVVSAVAHGGLIFSTIMHTTRARWAGPLSGLAESFAAFFPVSFVLFLVLFIGREHVFTWLHHDLHGKEVWLNLPFLFGRDAVGLLILYGLGLAYLYHALWFKLDRGRPASGLRLMLYTRWDRAGQDAGAWKRRQGVLSILYMLAFAGVLSLIGYDLVMSMDPHWYSTLFGAYSFVKAIYVGFGGIIIMAALLHLNPANGFGLADAQFHDMGKLFFAFCLVWADFFYCQFVVIWYGNIPEETAYIIERTMAAPWNRLAWLVFVTGFILPFLILLNKRIKTRPKAMMAICTMTIAAIWLEHFLVLGPSFHPHAPGIPIGVAEALMALGFIGLLVLTVAGFLERFPETVLENGTIPAGKEAL